MHSEGLYWASEGSGPHHKGGDDTPRLCPLDVLSPSGPWGSLGRLVLVEDSENGVSGSQPSRIWRLVTGLCGCRCWAEGTVVVLVARALYLPPPKCDMQKLTVDELKRLLYDTFCEHLSMKDIENIIMTEEESHLGTAEECPVDVESE